jgi:hypothetical protein
MQTKQILQAFNTWHKILEPKQMEANITSKTNISKTNITSLQLIIDDTQNPPSIVCAQNPPALSFCIFFIYLSYLTNINN